MQTDFLEKRVLPFDVTSALLKLILPSGAPAVEGATELNRISMDRASDAIDQRDSAAVYPGRVV